MSAPRPSVEPGQLASDEGSGWGWRVAAACAVLVSLCFHQAPGKIVPDTKLDLTANPAGLLVRAVAGWDDDALGQLQNQAYGYLFPVGPFHWALHVLGVPSWAAQRLWWSVILCVAFVGFWRLARALGIGVPWTRFAASALYALGPKFLGEVAITSVEVWPLALAPWVLLPLVSPSRGPTHRRLLLSALAFGLIGGVNAVATGAALVLPTMWFLTRSPLRIAVRQWLAWLGACVVASLWWLMPLFVLGRYSPAFLDWIEDSRATTAYSSPMAAVQGTTAWLNHLVEPGGATWPAGWLLVTVPGLVLITGLVAVLGLLGLTMTRHAERGWLLVSLTVGLVLLTAGYLGGGGSWLAGPELALLDGPLAAARNTHKFDMVVRIPLLLGLAGLPVGLVPAGARGRRATVLGVVLVLVATAAPALGQKLPRPGAYPQISVDWTSAAAWLDSRAEQGSVLVLPASSFADFSWGSTRDEPFQALLRRPFVVRDAVPLGSAGTTRVLDEVMRRLAEGDGSAELRQAVAGLGVRYVVVRNDLRLDVAGTDPVALHQALERSGLERVASFGLPAHLTFESDSRTVDERTVLAYPAIEVYDVGDADGATRLVPLSSMVVVDGGPEDVVSLSGGESPAGGAFAALLGSDANTIPLNDQSVVLTDGNRRQEVEFGRVTDNRSAPLAANQPGRRQRVALDYQWDKAAPQTSAAWRGVSKLTTSSSADDAGSTIFVGGSSSAAAAFDGDPGTRWISGNYGDAVGEWLEVTFAAKVDLAQATVSFSSRSPVSAHPDVVAIETDSGTTVIRARPDGRAQSLGAGPGLTSRLRITLHSVSATGFPSAFSIAEVSIPGVVARSALAVPRPAKSPSSILLRSQGTGSLGCYEAGGRPVCASKFLRQTDEGAGLFRDLDLPEASSYEAAGEVVARMPGAARLLHQEGEPSVTSTSSLVPSPAARAAVVLDGRVDTGWIAGPDDAQPELSIRLPEPRTLSGLQFLRDQYLAASKPRTIQVTLDGGEPLRRVVDRAGKVALPTTRAQSISIRFLDRDPLVSVESRSSFWVIQPVGASEILIDGARDLHVTDEATRRTGAPCGFGPTITIGSEQVATRVDGTIGDILAGRRLQWTPCGSAKVRVAQGEQSLSAAATAEFLPVRLTLGSPDSVERQFAETVDRTGLTTALPVRLQRSILVVPHNFNDGWSATTAEGRRLQPIRVNGWQQGYVVPEGAPASVVEEFTPNTWHRLGLLIGFAALLGLVLVLRFGTDRRVQRKALSPAPAAHLRRVALGALVLATGWVGLGAALATALALRAKLLRRANAPLWVLVAGTLALAASVLMVIEPHLGIVAALTQLLIVFAVATAVVGGRVVDSRRRPHRMIGRSSK